MPTQLQCMLDTISLAPSAYCAKGKIGWGRKCFLVMNFKKWWTCGLSIHTHTHSHRHGWFVLLLLLLDSQFCVPQVEKPPGEKKLLLQQLDGGAVTWCLTQLVWLISWFRPFFFFLTCHSRKNTCVTDNNYCCFPLCIASERAGRHNTRALKAAHQNGMQPSWMLFTTRVLFLPCGNMSSWAKLVGN